jgi:hypothetical protein
MRTALPSRPARKGASSTPTAPPARASRAGSIRRVASTTRGTAWPRCWSPRLARRTPTPWANRTSTRTTAAATTSARRSSTSTATASTTRATGPRMTGWSGPSTASSGAGMPTSPELHTPRNSWSPRGPRRAPPPSCTSTTRTSMRWPPLRLPALRTWSSSPRGPARAEGRSRSSSRCSSAGRRASSSAATAGSRRPGSALPTAARRTTPSARVFRAARRRRARSARTSPAATIQGRRGSRGRARCSTRRSAARSPLRPRRAGRSV